MKTAVYEMKIRSIENGYTVDYTLYTIGKNRKDWNCNKTVFCKDINAVTKIIESLTAKYAFVNYE